MRIVASEEVLGPIAVAHALLPIWDGADHALHRVLKSAWSALHVSVSTPREQYIDHVAYAVKQAKLPEQLVELIQSAHAVKVEGLVSEKFRAVESEVKRHCSMDSDAGLKVSASSGAPFPDASEIGAFGASGFWLPPVGNRSSILEVQLWLPELGPRTWASVPRVLFHEFVCHGSQRTSVDNADPLSEGLMDLIAEEICIRTIERTFPEAPALATTMARRLGDARTKSTSGSRIHEDKDRAARRRGREAGRRLGRRLDLLEGRHTDGAQLPDKLLQLGFEVNRVKASQADRRTFVWNVLRSTDDTPVGPLDLTADLALSGALHGWLGGTRSAEELLYYM